ncbi:FAD-dependent oxidoreductase, partial [Klebsiella michiganensis]
DDAVTLLDGRRIAATRVVLATGVQPNVALAKASGIRCARGIVVDQQMQTSVPDIYAIGECASWNNRVYGLVAPGYKMAQVAVDHILGSENAFTGADMSA